MNKLEDIKNIVEEIGRDSSKFYNQSNKAAGTRARKGLQQLKSLAQELRVEIQNAKAEKQAEASADAGPPGEADYHHAQEEVPGY